MASVNKVILVGNLGKDPETRYMPSGDAITTITLATTDRYKDKSGEKQEKTEWHRVVFFGKLAEIAGEYLKKGRPVYIEGSLRTREWEKDGVKRYTTEIVANEMQMLGSRGEGGGGGGGGGGGSWGGGEDGGGGGRGKPASSSGGGGGFDDIDDDIPF